MPTRTPSRAWWTAARQPRLLALLVLLLLAGAVCGRLGAWQLDRAAQWAEAAAERAADERADAPAVPLDDVARPQQGFTREQVGRRVTVRGSYDAAVAQFVVPEPASSGEVGVVVVTAFRVTGGAGDGAVLPVVRGWVAGEPEAWSDELGAGGSLAVPAGERVLVGSLAAAEASASGAGDGVLGSISPGQLANLWGSPIYAGSLRLEASQPGDPAAVLGPPPDRLPGRGPGVAWQNIAYAVQWWIFGAFAVAVWVRLVRDEARRLPADASEAPVPAGHNG